MSVITKEASKGLGMKKSVLVLGSVLALAVYAQRTEFPEGKDAVFAFTFDDGTVDQYEVAAPVLDKYGIKAIFNIVPERIGREKYMTWEQVADLAKRGHAIGNHTLSHLNLNDPKLSEEDVENEIVRGYEEIKRHTGYEAKVVCYPYNASGPRSEKIVKKHGFKSICWRLDNWGAKFDEDAVDKAVAKAVKDKAYRYILMHGVRPGGGWAALADASLFERIVKRLLSHENVWVAGYEESVAYREAYRADRERIKYEAELLSLNGQWDFRFEEGKSIEQAGKADFAATGKMSVPGCYDAQGELRFKRGTGLYRRSFTLARPVENAWLVVNGMGLRGAFEIDGKSLGVHPYPYARLELATGPLAAGEHTLFAALDNRLDWRTMKLARTFYDFYFFGGFYRDVELRFDNTKLLVRTRDYRTGEVEIEVAGEEGERTLVFDGTNRVKAVFRDGKAVVKVPNFRVWSPAHPNLHTVQFNGATFRFGIRTVEARNKRIYLNGEPIFLKGVNRHEQSRGRGVVMTRDECVRDLKLLKDLGANFIRGAHYQQDPKFLDLCDEMGFLVWEESLGWGNGQDYTKEGPVEELKDETFVAQQLHTTREMVRASFNHPSVIIYAFLNECGSHKKECKELVDRLIGEIRALDSGRLVTFACNVCDRDICHENTDIVAFNAYPGTIPARPGTPKELRDYVKKDFDRTVKRFRAKYPEKPIMVSESGCAGFHGLRDECAAFGTEDFQNEYLVDILDALWANEDVVGFAIWQFADSTTHQRNSAGKSGRIFGFSTAGLYDFERRPKLSVETVKRYFAAKDDT